MIEKKDSITIVNIRPEFAEALEELQIICFPTVPEDELFDAEEFEEMCEVFPEGTFVVLDGDRVIGLGAGVYIEYDFESGPHDHETVTKDGHHRDSPWYYGTDISVHPEYRGRGIGRKLYDARKGVVIRDNKKGIVAGGFLPDFAKHKDNMSIDDYIAKVVAGELWDSTLSFQIKNGFEVVGIIPNYMTIGNSDGYASQIVWHNPHYQESETD